MVSNQSVLTQALMFLVRGRFDEIKIALSSLEKKRQYWQRQFWHFLGQNWRVFLQCITEEECQLIKKSVGRPLPTMAISKIKLNKDGKPDHAKYHIVVLGNLDPHNWSSNDCFAPVLSALKLCLLLAIATHFHHIPKQGNVSMAFVQSILPDLEKYVCTPPKGCPFTPPNTYAFFSKNFRYVYSIPCDRISRKWRIPRANFELQERIIDIRRFMGASGQTHKQTNTLTHQQTNTLAH